MTTPNYSKLSKEKLIDLLKEKDDKLDKLTKRLEEFEKKLESSSVFDRIEALERSSYRQEQYSRRECIEIVGLSEEFSDQDALEERVVEVFQAAGVNVKARDFHAIHPLKNQKVIIAKCVNRRDAIAILRAKRSLREADDSTKKKLGAKGKIYINESLCPAYRRLFGVCNALFRKKLLSSSYTINGTIMVCTEEGGEKKSIGHLNDLKVIFKNGEVETAMAEHSGKSK